jgi:ABC-type multidrug transport system ATPase subunit/pSer/pThr/pTyr-binding forkhead associated (FHA) protein
VTDERRCTRCNSQIGPGRRACAACGQVVEAQAAPASMGRWFSAGLASGAATAAPTPVAPAAPPPPAFPATEAPPAAGPPARLPAPPDAIAANATTRWATRSTAPEPSAPPAPPPAPAGPRPVFTTELKRSWFTPPAAVTPAPPGPDPSAARLPGDRIDLALEWGRLSRVVPVPAAGATIGSGREADITVPAPFLDPVHACVRREGDYWVVAPASPTGFVLHRGAEVARGWLADGEVFRLANANGNFVSLRLARSQPSSGRPNHLRGALPAPGQVLAIGSAPDCQIVLEHPLVRPRHALLGADDGGLWIDDRVTVSGTYVNGQRLRGRQTLTRDDVIQIGPFSARIAAHTLEPMDKVAGIDVRVLDGAVEVRVKDQPAKVLLHGVQLHLRPGSLTAVAGPSGAGKTTLMRLLSGQAAASGGEVQYNRVDLKRCRGAYAPLMGFVPQDDVVHADLTVDEALGFQARLRLGKHADLVTRRHQIDKAISFVGLEQQRGQLVRTLSGGQRKRVSIATELLNDPEILFLDEPTSGLDPGLDKRMMLLLRLLADQGRTVVLTTHAISHVDVCDNLILVGPGGNVIYAGDPEQALPWFGVQTLGEAFGLWETKEEAVHYAARLRREAADHPFLDAARPVGTARPPAPPPAVPTPPVPAHSSAVPTPLAPADSSAVPAWRASASRPLANWFQMALEDPVPPVPNAVPKPPFGSPAWREVLLYQGRIFAKRYLVLLGRDRTALTYSLLQGAVVSVLLALVSHPSHFSWFGVSRSGLVSSGGLSVALTTSFVLGTSGVWFGMINGVRELVKERTIWRREALVGASVSGYLASKVVVLGGLALIQSVSSVAVLGAILGLDTKGPVGAPLITMSLSVFLANMAGVALALAVSAVAASSDRAMSLVPYMLITQMVLCGALFPLGAASFISWAMPARWAVAAVGGIGGIGVAAHSPLNLLPPQASFAIQSGQVPAPSAPAGLSGKFGLFPYTFGGLFLDWLILALIIAAGIGLAGRALGRQARAWSVG